MRNHLNFLFRNSVLFKIFIFSILARIVLAFAIPVVGDESYYWIWGRNLQLSYFDHPPAVSWMTWISNWFYKSSSTVFMGLSLRLPFITLSSLTFLIWLKNYTLQQKESGFINQFAILYLLNPLLGIGGIFATPDVPLLFFWALSYYAILKIKIDQQAKWYRLLGISLGLGFCSKYHIVLLPITVLISMALLKELKIIQIKKLILTLLYGIIFSLPVVVWNSRNDWVSFAFQLNHGFNAKKVFDITWSLTYILAQIVIFNPFVLFYLLRQVKASLPKNMALSQWGFFLMSSFKSLVEANWPITAHAQGLLIVDRAFQPRFKKSIFYWCILWLLLLVFALTPFGINKFNHLPQTIAASEIYQATKEFRPLYGPTYQMSSLMFFVSHENISKLYLMARHDFYDSLEGSFPKENQFYVLKYTYADWPEWMKGLYRFYNVKTISKYDLELYKVTRE